MADIVVGIAILLLGLGVAFFGLCLFLIMLPIWGFLASFFVGAGSIEAFFGDGFLSTVGGWIAGFVTGILFAPSSPTCFGTPASSSPSHRTAPCSVPASWPFSASRLTGSLPSWR